MFIILRPPTSSDLEERNGARNSNSPAKDVYPIGFARVQLRHCTFFFFLNVFLRETRDDSWKRISRRDVSGMFRV